MLPFYSALYGLTSSNSILSLFSQVEVFSHISGISKRPEWSKHVDSELWPQNTWFGSQAKNAKVNAQ